MTETVTISKKAIIHTDNLLMYKIFGVEDEEPVIYTQDKDSILFIENFVLETIEEQCYSDKENQQMKDILKQIKLLLQDNEEVQVKLLTK